MSSDCHGPVPVDDPDKDPLEVSMPGVTILNGKSRSGKSHLMKYIMCKNRHKFGFGIAFSNSGDRPGNLSYVPAEFKHSAWSDAVVEEFIKVALAVAAATNGELMGFVIIDDDMTGFNSPLLVRLITQTFHLNIYIIITTQHINKLPPAVREGGFQVGIYRTKTKRACDAAYDSYGHDFEDVKDFRAMLRKIPQHVVWWLNVHQGSEGKLFKAPPVIPEFHLLENLPQTTKKRKVQHGGAATKQ